MDTKPDHWIGNVMKEKKVKRALRLVLPPDTTGSTNCLTSPALDQAAA
jgi:hypothetical protein